MAKKSDLIGMVKNPDFRFLENPVTIDVENVDEKRTSKIEGYALKFNSETTIAGLFREVIRPGALKGVIENSDIRCVFNHNKDYVLARSNKGVGTLKLSVDDVGLKYSYETPDRSYARDLEDAIAKGDVSGSSFHFHPKLKDRWVKRDGELPLREILEFSEFFDVSVVTFPAYPDADVAKRSLDNFKAENLDVVVTEDQPEKRETLSVYEAQVLINSNL